MPMIEVRFFRDDQGAAPVWDWLQALNSGGKHDRKVFNKCMAKIKRLAELGHELDRPESGTLRDGIYELRIKFSPNEYRILYFHADECAVLTNAFVKNTDRVPDVEIDRAIRCKHAFNADPKGHTYEQEQEDEKDQ